MHHKNIKLIGSDGSDGVRLDCFAIETKISTAERCKSAVRYSASTAFALFDHLDATATFIPKPINRHPQTFLAID